MNVLDILSKIAFTICSNIAFAITGDGGGRGPFVVFLIIVFFAVFCGLFLLIGTGR